ncbi:hypothetical protein HYZ99_03100 [Candidatus Peregrinibacteria bacterium]|nr:hypothetical protein [Candidatus Peregrinibacteria bacterium]
MSTDQNSAPASSGAPVSPSAPAKPVLSPERDIEENKDLAAFSYLWIMSVIVYFLKKDSPFVRFHSKQAMVLFALTIPVWLIPIALIGRLLELLILAGMIIGFLGAAQGQWKDVPFIGPFSRGETTLRQSWQQLVARSTGLSKVLKSMFRRTKKYVDADVTKSKKNQDTNSPPPSAPPSSL